jgi:hypothetical protein
VAGEYIRRNFGVSYKKVRIYSILHSSGLSCRKGKGYIHESAHGEDQVERIKKLQLREIESTVLFEDEISLSNTATVPVDGV